MVLKFVTKEALRFTTLHTPNRKRLSFTAAMPTARLLLRIGLTPLKRGSPKHRSSRRRQSQRAPGIREQPRLKRTRTVQDFLQRNFIIEPHFAGRKSLL